MNKMMIADASGFIRSSWDRLSRLPGGKKIFSRSVGLFVPYSGSIGADIVELRKGYSKVTLRDRRAVRNHLQSIHAIALANVAEICSGLGLIYSLPDKARAILIKFEIEYVKKARGTLTAEATFTPPTATVKQDIAIAVSVYDASKDVVAKAQAHWRVGALRSRDQ